MNDEMNEQNSTEPEPEIIVDEQKNNVDIGGWLKQGWEIFKTDIVKFIVSILIVGVVSVMTCLVLSGPMMVGLFKCILKKTRGEDFEYGDLFDGVKTQFLPAFVLVIATFVFVAIVGGILMLIPFVGQVAIYAVQIAAALFVNYMYLQMAEMDETLEVGKLVDLGKSTLNKLKDDYAMYLVWALVVSVVGGAGVIICCVGALATYSISLIAVTISYVAIFKSGDEVTVVAEEIAVEE